MVCSNRVFPAGDQSSHEASIPIEQPTFQVTARLPNDRPPASARAALVDNEAEIQYNGFTPRNCDGEEQQPRLLCSKDSYNFGGEGTVTLDAVAEFSTEPDESEEAEECEAAAEVQAVAGARRVSHAPTHTLMGPAPSPLPPADTEQPSGSLFLGFLESLGVARSGSSDLQAPPSRAQSFIVTTSAASAAILRATSKLHELAMGDDHDVHDKWDNFDDDNPHTSSTMGSAPGSRRGSTSGSRRGSAGSVPGSRKGSVPGSRRSSGAGTRSRRGSTGSAPASRRGSAPASRRGSMSGGSTEGGCSLGSNGEAPAKTAAKPTQLADEETMDPGATTESEDGETYEDVDAAGKPPAPVGPGGFKYEHATVKVLLWYYLQTMFYSAIVGAVSMPMVTIFSSFRWHITVEVAEDQEGIIPLIQPNRPVFQWMMLFWIANPLTFYCPLLLACIKRSIRLPWQMYAVCAFTMTWGAIVCTLFYVFDVPYWFWYLDLFIVLAAYVPCMCTVGWFIDEEAHWKDRLWDVAFTATLETVVATATLLYCWFLMPLFYALMASWQKLVWLCTVHPLYFELTTGFIVRKALARNSVLGRANIMYFLTIVHGMAHQVSITTMLQASVEPTRILAVTVVVYNSSKLFWRSTVIHRHMLLDRVLKGWSYKFPEEQRTELARMVSVHVLTEVVLENASILVTPYLMYRMYDEPLFMMVVPKTFHATGGAYSANTMVTMIFVMLSITVFFDILFWLLNYHVLQFLPLINTWRRIKKARLWYLSFLIYAFVFMGVLFVFLIMMMLPRGTYCKSDNYCDCVTSAYESLCRGELFAVHHDYLVDIDPSLYV